MKLKSRSPLKDKPLRYVGQSADEAIDDLLNEKVFLSFVLIVVLAISVTLEWMRYFTPATHPPVLITVIFVLTSAFYIYRIYKQVGKFKRLKLGRDGERAVGQYLESLRESGCHIFHDIVGKNFNVDHVVISSKGIFVIETKTYSKPSMGKSTITFDGQRILINSKESKTDIITQVKAASSHIKEILKSSTGKDFEPFPVILFPGWYVEGEGNKKGKIWVLEPKAFKKFVDRQTVKLSADDVALASYHLSRHIRTS